MDDNKEKNNAQNNIDTYSNGPGAEGGKEGDKRWGIFMIIVLIGFVVIYFLVTRIYGLIAARLGWKVIRAIPLLLVAFFWYIWGQVCLYIKNEHNID